MSPLNRFSCISVLFFLLIGSLNGQYLSRQLLQKDTKQNEPQQISSEDRLKLSLQGYLASGALYNATTFVANKIQGGETWQIVKAMVQIVSEEDRQQTQELGKVFAQLNERYQNYYQSLLSLALTSSSSLNINAFDKLLCLQTNPYYPDLCFGDEPQIQTLSSKEKSSITPEVEYSFEGQKLLKQMLNNDYNSAAWSIVGSMDTMKAWEFVRVVNQAVSEGAGKTVGEAILQAIRQAARSGQEVQLGTLLQKLLVQDYYKEVVEILGKALAIASQQGQSIIIQQLFLEGMKSEGNIRSMVELMHQVALQGGEDGPEAVAMVIGDTLQTTLHNNIIAQIFVHAMCRGEAFWISFGQIYEDLITMFTCDLIETQFLTSIAFASNYCQHHSPLNLYQHAPNLQSCQFLQNYKPNLPLNLQPFYFITNDVRYYIDEFQPQTAFYTFFELKNIDFEEIVNMDPSILQQYGPLPEFYQVFESQGFVLENIDENVADAQNAQNVRNALQASYQVVELLKSLQQQLTTDVRYQDLVYVDESASLSDSDCVDIQPEDNITVTCEERKDWGACEKDWMQESNYCALTCGFCVQTPVAQNTFWFQDNNNINNNNENVYEVIQEQKQNIVTDYNQLTDSDAPKPKKSRKQRNNKNQEKVSDDLCLDVVPDDNVTATCIERKEWGACEEQWMENNSFCAQTCGFCGEKTALIAPKEDNVKYVDSEEELPEKQVSESTQDTGSMSLLQLLAATASSVSDSETTELENKGIDN